jgi:hypothetical protein
MEISSPVALVLCGGASRGALEVGFYRAVQELGLRIDFVVGSSIGALNGAYITAGMPATDLEKLWLGFRRRDAITWNWKGLLQPRSHPGLYTLDPLRELLRRTLPATRFEDLRIPLSIATTDLQLGTAVHWRGLRRPGELSSPRSRSRRRRGFSRRRHLRPLGCDSGGADRARVSPRGARFSGPGGRDFGRTSLPHARLAL